MTGDWCPPIVFGVACAIAEERGSNPHGRPNDSQSSWPIWMDNIGAAAAALDRTAIMLRAQGTYSERKSARFIKGELKKLPKRYRK